MTTRSSTALLKPARSTKSVKTQKTYSSKISAVVHRTAEDFARAGVMSKATLREFDESCLTPIKRYTAAEIESLRRREEVSQGVFARYLGLSKNLISQWERGEKKPSGSALKLLSLIEKNGLDFVG